MFFYKYWYLEKGCPCCSEEFVLLITNRRFNCYFWVLQIIFSFFIKLMIMALMIPIIFIKTCIFIVFPIKQAVPF